MEFWQFLHTIQPSLLEACSSRSVLRSVFFWAPNQFNMAFRTRSSFWAVVQPVICISTCTHPVATCTSFSTLWSPSTTEGLWPSVLWAIPRVTPSRMDCTASGSRQVVIWLRASATILSHPFWYSNWKLNLTRAPTHQWPLASKLGVVLIYVKGLLSVLTKKGQYSNYSLKCSMMAHFSTRNDSSFHGQWGPGCHGWPDDIACLLVFGTVLLPVPP